MGAILVDDSRTGSVGIYGSALGRELAKISQYRVKRHSEYTWARNLRFLVYDNEDDDDQKGHMDNVVERRASDGDEDVMVERAIALSLQPDVGPTASSSAGQEDEKSQSIGVESGTESGKSSHDIERPFQAKNDSQDGNNDPSTRIQCRDSCETCSGYRRFPKHKRASRFRVVRFDPEAFDRDRLCNHYVAISYCWKSNNAGRSRKSNGSYRVRIEEEDGTVVERCNRAPDEVIDRAVAFAGSIGARLIWLDQECLPQDNGREHELGIQAMDMVYQRARWCAGLFESIIPSQGHLDSAVSVLDWAQQIPDSSRRQLRFRQGSDLTTGTFLQYLLEFLELLCQDPWNQRAWILQESFSSASHMIINIRITSKPTFNAPLCFQDRAPAGTINILMPEVDTLIKASKELLRSDVKYPVSGLSGVDYHGPPRPVFGRVWHILDSLEQLRPQMTDSNNPLAFHHISGGVNFGPRHRCNAALALSLLRSRSNHRPADRLAIVANLCDYEIRLDTVAIECNFTSLSLCLFALAFINGDLSLLIPSVYQLSTIQAPLEGPSWALPFSDILHSVNTRHLRAGYEVITRGANRYYFSEDGIVLPASVWQVDRPVDLSPIQRKWKAYWDSLTGKTMNLVQRENETADELRERQEQVRQLISEGEIVPQELRDSPDLLTLQGLKPELLTDPTIRAFAYRHLAIYRLDRHPAAQWMLGILVLEILQYLHANNEGCLANSIWHSIRKDYVKVEPNSEPEELPDDVEDVLANERLVSSAWQALQLDQDDQGSFNQVWLIDRIMRDGMIWTGKCITPPVGRPSGDKSAQGPQENADPSLKQSAERSGPKTIIQAQNAAQMAAILCRSSLYEQELAGGALSTTLNVGSLIGFMMHMWEATQNQDDRLSRRVSTFDVDGPCLVVTPGDGDMERLPRSALRSLDICWVVEAASGDSKAEGGGVDGVHEKQRELDSDSGMGAGSEEVVQETAAYLRSSGQAENMQSSADKGKDRRSKGSRRQPQKTVGSSPDGTFRVLERVKGMWEIMGGKSLGLYEFV